MSDELIEPASPSSPRSTRTAVQVLSGLSFLLLAAAVALAVIVKGHLDDRNALRDARTDSVVAARQEILNLDSLNYTTIDSDLERVLRGATGSFKDQFTRARATLKPTILANKSVSTGRVLSAGVVRADTGTATVLVAADRTVADISDPNGGVVHDRWRVDLEKHGGSWLIADLQPVA